MRAHDDPKNPDYTKTPFAWWLSNGAAIIEFTNCFLLFGNNWYILCVACGGSKRGPIITRSATLK